MLFEAILVGGVDLVAVAVALSFSITAMGEWLLDAVSSLFNSIGALRQGLKTIAQPLALIDAPDAMELTVSTGAMNSPASRRGTTSFRTGSVPSARSAWI